MKQKRFYLLALLLPFLLGCLCSQSKYVPLQAGDCFVPPQGDPVYDQFYAQQVNPQNCSAYQDQAQAHKIEAEKTKILVDANATSMNTFMNLIGAALTGLIFIVVIILIVYSVTKRNG